MNTKKAAEKRTVRLQADLEATDTTWWEAAYSAPKPALSRRVVAWIEDPDEDLYLTPAEARAFKEWASTLPGYETGIESAPHPFILHWAAVLDGEKS
jgi:hypothetical protein